MVLGQAAVKVCFGSQHAGGSCPELPGTDREGEGAGWCGAASASGLCLSSHGATVLSRTLLTSLMGALGSVFGFLAQSADRLTHQEGKYGPAVGGVKPLAW